MPRFFFDLRDEQEWLPDDEGIELPDAAAARENAMVSLAEILRDGLPTPGGRSLAMRVSDAGHRMMFDVELDLKVVEPAD
jgi:hypothetical protein